MSEHYYSNKPTSAHETRKWQTTLRGMNFTFETDAGVFSRDGVDYGSRLLIETMTIPPGGKVLDIGCGYGPIGLVAARLHPDNEVTMADINERAVSLATRNATHNGISNVKILQSNIYENIVDDDYDIVLTNPPIRAGKAVVHAILSGARERLKVGGELWIVIQKKQGSPSAFAKLQELYRLAEEVDKDKGYRIFRAVK